MAISTIRCTLCTGITNLTTVTRPGTPETYPVCSCCHTLVISQASLQNISLWNSYSLLLERLDKQFGRGLQLANIA